MNVSICKKYIVRSPFLHLTFLASIWSAHRELVYRHYTHHCTQCAIFVFIKVFFSELTYFVMSLRSNQIWSKFNVCKAPFTLHCKDLHPKYISTTTLEMYPTSVSGAQLPDVAYYISSTSPLHLLVVIITTISKQFALHPYIHKNYISWLYTEKTYISNMTEKM